MFPTMQVLVACSFVLETDPVTCFSFYVSLSMRIATVQVLFMQLFL